MYVAIAITAPLCSSRLRAVETEHICIPLSVFIRGAFRKFFFFFFFFLSFFPLVLGRCVCSSGRTVSKVLTGCGGLFLMIQVFSFFSFTFLNVYVYMGFYCYTLYLVLLVHSCYSYHSICGLRPYVHSYLFTHLPKITNSCHMYVCTSP